MRRIVTHVFLWGLVTFWGIGLGAKIFDLLVLASAWGADPPASLVLYPYGKSWPTDPGDFFQPLSALILLTIIGALWSGWKTTRRFRQSLLISMGAFVLIWIATPTLFWPLIGTIYDVAHHRVTISDAETAALVRRWFWIDSIRILVIAAGFFSALYAITLPSAEFTNFEVHKDSAPRI